MSNNRGILFAIGAFNGEACVHTGVGGLYKGNQSPAGNKAGATLTDEGEGDTGEGEKINAAEAVKSQLHHHHACGGACCDNIKAAASAACASNGKETESDNTQHGNEGHDKTQFLAEKAENHVRVSGKEVSAPALTCAYAEKSAFSSSGKTLGLLPACAIGIVPDVSPGCETLGNIGLNGEDKHNRKSGACKGEENGGEASASKERYNKECAEEYKCGAEVTHECKCTNANCGECYKHKEVSSAEKAVEGGGAGIDISNLDKFGGLESEAAEAEPVCCAIACLARNKVYSKKTQCKNGNGPAHDFGSSDISEPEAQYQIENNAGKEQNELLEHIFGGRSGNNRNAESGKEKSDGLNLEANAVESSHNEIVKPANRSNGGKAENNFKNKFLIVRKAKLQSEETLNGGEDEHAQGRAYTSGGVALGFNCCKLRLCEVVENEGYIAERENIPVMYRYTLTAVLDAVCEAANLGVKVIKLPFSVSGADKACVGSGGGGGVKNYIAASAAAYKAFPVGEGINLALGVFKIGPNFGLIFLLKHASDASEKQP